MRPAAGKDSTEISRVGAFRDVPPSARMSPPVRGHVVTAALGTGKKASLEGKQNA